MKKLLLATILSCIVFLSYSQCVIAPICTNDVLVTGNNLNNQSVNSSACFTGTGVIPNSYNWNNWNFLTFNGSIISNQSINFQNGPKKTFNYGNINYMANTSIDGQDTIVVMDNSALHIENLIANNFPNVIVLGNNSNLNVKYQGVNTNFYPGDTIKTVQGNNSNNVVVVQCASVPLGSTVLLFNLTKDILYWTVETNGYTEVQYSENGSNFVTIYTTSDITGYLKLTESGLYRLKVGNVYSNIEIFNMTLLTPDNDRIYFWNNQFYQKDPHKPYQGYKLLK